MSAYGIYFVVGLIVNAVKIQSPAFKKRLDSALEDFKGITPESDRVSDRVYRGFGYLSGVVGGVIGAATISLPAIIVKHLYDLYKDDNNNDDDDTQGAVKV